MENNAQMFKDYPDIVSVDDMMVMLKIGRVLAYKLLTGRKIKAIKVGKQYKIPKANIITYVCGTEETV